MKSKFSIISNYIFIVLISFSILTGCLSIKHSGVKSGKKLFETFYIGNEGTQYFIKPLSFYNPKDDKKLQIDFTFRYKNEIKDSVNVNFFIISSNILKSIDSLSFSNDTNKIISKNVKLLFNEKKKKLFKSRFSTKISLDYLNKMFRNESWEILIYTGNMYYTFIPTKKTKKAINILQNNIFILFI